MGLELSSGTKLTSEDIAKISGAVVTEIESEPELSLRMAKLTVNALALNPDLGSLLVEQLEDKFPQSVLSREKIIEGREKGYVIIDPYRPERVQTSSYDVSLGEYFWVARSAHPGRRLHNPYNPAHVARMWKGPFRAKTIREHLSKRGEFCEDLEKEDFDGLNMDDPVIILRNGETILAHTEEFIGGKDKITEMMKARSSTGRSFISVCKDAGWGDVGYFNRWTMEIQNNLEHEWSLLAVGRPIAQMVLFRVNPVESMQYSGDGSYQKANDLETLKKEWRAENMLPNFRRYKSG